MKKSLIKKIVIGLLSLFFVIPVISYGYETNFGLNAFAYTEISDSEMTSKYNYTIESNDISEVNIEWLQGNINVILYEGETIQIEEYSKLSLTRNETAYVSEANSQVNVYFNEELSFDDTQNSTKNLNIFIPNNSSLETLKIKSSKSNIEISGLNIKHLTAESVDGEIRINDMDSKFINVKLNSGLISMSNIFSSNLEVASWNNDTIINQADTENFVFDSTMGDLSINGNIENMQISSVYGDLAIITKHVPSELDLDSVGGNIEVTMPDNDGFILNTSQIYGEIISDDFNLIEDEENLYYKDNNSIISYDIKTSDSDITVKMGEFDSSYQSYSDWENYLNDLKEEEALQTIGQSNEDEDDGEEA